MLHNILKSLGESALFSRKTPKFWHKNGLVAQLVLPLSVIYFFAKRIFKDRNIPKKFPAKIICIGNAIVGGAGKTPTAAAIYKILKRLHAGKKIAFVTTAYKANLRGPLQVDLKIHKAADVGDEAFMLASVGDVVICKSRLEAVEFAVAQKYEILILDDGLHDKRIQKDISFLVIDGKYGFGNELVMPAGPLRDRLDFATEGTDHIIMIGKDEKNSAVQVERSLKKKLAVFNCYVSFSNMPDEKTSYVAFAGIGRPEKFFDMLEKDMKLDVKQKMEFPDHHQYNDEDIKFLKELAQTHKAKLVTTEKDLVKLPPEFASEVECIKIEVKFEDRAIEDVLG